MDVLLSSPLSSILLRIIYERSSDPLNTCDWRSHLGLHAAAVPLNIFLSHFIYLFFTLSHISISMLEMVVSLVACFVALEDMKFQI